MAERSKDTCNKYDRVTTGMLVLTVLLVYAFYFFYMATSPKDPKISIQAISFSNSLPYNISSTWNLQIQISNPNRHVSVHYKNIRLVLFKNQGGLNPNTFSPFNQGGHNLTTLDLSFSVSAVRKRLIASGYGGGQHLSLDLELGVSTSFKNSTLGAMNDCYYIFWCNDIDMEMAADVSSGKMISAPKICPGGGFPPT